MSKFKKFWDKGRQKIRGRLFGFEALNETNYYILLALNLLLEAKERQLFPQDFTEE